MMMAMAAMHMAVLDLHGRGRAHFGDPGREAQILAGQRMVAVQQHHRPLDLDHVVDLGLALVIGAAQLAADLDAWREFALGDGAPKASALGRSTLTASPSALPSMAASTLAKMLS